MSDLRLHLTQSRIGLSQRRKGGGIMIGNGQWVTTRDEKSVKLFLADIELHQRLDREWAQRRQAWLRDVACRVRALSHRA